MFKRFTATLLACFLSIQSAFAFTHGVYIQGNSIFNIGASTAQGICGYEYPFINFFKCALQFTSTGGFAFPGALDANGYPSAGVLSTNISAAGGSILVPPSKTGSDQWVLKWTGKAGDVTNPGFNLGVATTEVGSSGCVKGATSSSMTVYGTGCRIVFTYNANPSSITSVTFLAGATFDGTLSGMILCRVSQESLIDAGEIFNPDFITALRAINPRAIRMANWSGQNGQNLVANASQQTPVGAFSYASRYWDTTVWAGAASGTNSYSITFAGVPALVDGATIQLQFTNASSGVQTLNLNALGAVSLADTGGTALSSGAVAANSLWTLVYDAGLNKWLGRAAALEGGTPLAIQIALCNKLNVDCWLHFGAHVTDTLATTQATLAKNTLVNTAWYEYSLEMWNFGYTQTTWAVARGTALGFPAGNNERYHGWYGLRFRQLAGIVGSTYGAQSNFKRLLAFQAFGDTSATNTYRMQGHDLNGTSFPNYAAAGYPNYDTAPNRPTDLAEVHAYAMYSNGAQLMAFDADYINVQAAATITGATLASPVQFTATAHGYVTGQRVYMGANAAAGKGTNFTGGWTAFNQQSYNVTVTGANTFTVPVDTTGFSAYSSNAGSAERYNNEASANGAASLLAAADAFATSGTVANACNGLTTPVAWVDCDLQAGTNYGTLGTQTLSNLNSAIYPGWNTIAASYGVIVAGYEGTPQGNYPGAAVCTAWGISSTYCGATGKIANLLGVPTSPSISSYKMSSAFQTSVTLQYTQFMAQSRSKNVADFDFATEDQWSKMTGDLYSLPFTSRQALIQWNAASH